MHLRCPHCQYPIELADLPASGEITCLGCGSSFQLANFSTATWAEPTNKRMGKFEVLGTLGHGAFGTVVKAHDTELDRIVAIKIPRASNVGPDPQDLDRFLREARSVAQLRFPSIITIHEVGINEGVPYLVCDFVEGITLADHLSGRGFPFRESAKLLAEVADALQYAHSLGVVHRDVKPSNIMIRPDGSPCVMDFGLAKRDAGEITMTIDGQILGTPAYMSPEQARGEAHRVDGRSDVYSLGVILYQLLTGELPFRGNKVMLLHQVLHEEPRSPRTLNDKIPRDLATIALKAMAKEPGRRYGSAKEMAEDLRRWLAGEPIRARPIGTIERTWRWCKRKPAWAAANAAILVALATFVAAFFVVSASLEQEQIERGKAEEHATSNKFLAESNRVLAEKETKARLDADERREKAEELTQHVRFAQAFQKSVEEPAAAMVATARLLPEAAKLKNRSVEESMRLHMGSWAQTVHPLRWVDVHGGKRVTVALSGDGQFVLTASDDNTARVWSVGTDKPIGPTLQHLERLDTGAVSADGKVALTCSGNKTVRLWETLTGNAIGPPLQHHSRVRAVALNAAGTIAVTASDDKLARLWDATTGNSLGPPLQHQDQINSVALSADGAIAVTGSHDKSARVWETKSGKQIGPPLLHSAWVCGVAVSADGKIVLTGTINNVAIVWDAINAKPIGAPLQHAALGVGMCLGAVALSADGKVALTGSEDRTARLWDAATGKSIGPALQHPAGVGKVALSADGTRILTRCWDNGIRLWETAVEKSIGPGFDYRIRCDRVALSADGKTVLMAGLSATAQLWNATTGNPLGTPFHGDWVEDVALSADGKVALTGSIDMTAQLWDSATGQPIGAPLKHASEVQRVGFISCGCFRG